MSALLYEIGFQGKTDVPGLAHIGMSQDSPGAASGTPSGGGGSVGTYLAFNGDRLCFSGDLVHFDQPAVTFGPDDALVFGAGNYVRFK